MFHQITTADGTTSQVWTNGDPERTGIAFRYITDAHPGEPLFCIRGRDRLAVPVVDKYLCLAAATVKIGLPVLADVDADLAKLRDWQKAHPNLLKYPDR